MSYTYRVIIVPDEKGTFHGYVPALPGCHTWGKTLAETKEYLREAMQVHNETLQDDGEEIPVDSGFESLETIEVSSGGKQKEYA